MQLWFPLRATGPDAAVGEFGRQDAVHGISQTTAPKLSSIPRLQRWVESQSPSSSRPLLRERNAAFGATKLGAQTDVLATGSLLTDATVSLRSIPIVRHLKRNMSSTVNNKCLFPCLFFQMQGGAS